MFSALTAKLRAFKPRAAAMEAVCIVSLAISTNGALVGSSLAQMAALPQPTFTLSDQNGVDFLSFNLYLELTDVTVGSKEHPLTHTLQSSPGGVWTMHSTSGPATPALSDSYAAQLHWMSGNRATCSPNQPPFIRVYVGGRSEYFRGCMTYTLWMSQSGSALVFNADGTYSYTTSSGMTVVFEGSPQSLRTFDPRKIVYPDGRVLTYWYFNDGTAAPTLKSVTRSDGFQLKYNYSQLSSGNYALSSVTAINNAHEYCNPTASTCTLTKAWPTASYSWNPGSGLAGVLTVTDSINRVTRYTSDSNRRTIGIKLPSSASADNITYEYCDSNCSQYNFMAPLGVQFQNYVLRVTRDGQVWNYSGNPRTGATHGGCDVATYASTNPVGAVKQVTLSNCFSQVGGVDPPSVSFIKLTDVDGSEANGPVFPYIQSAVMPEGNQVSYTWDGRGNLTLVTKTPKANSPLAPITLSANYDTTCNNRLTCNKPNWSIDGLNHQTDSTYDPVHGGLTSLTLPADSNGIRPKTRYGYTSRHAWVLNASDSYVQSAAPIWVLTTERFCRTSAATESGCAVAGDEVVKTYDYGPNSGPNNLFLRGVAVTANGVTQRTCYGYDRMGNRISETQPAAGLTSCP